VRVRVRRGKYPVKNDSLPPAACRQHTPSRFYQPTGTARAGARTQRSVVREFSAGSAVSRACACDAFYREQAL